MYVCIYIIHIGLTPNPRIYFRCRQLAHRAFKTPKWLEYTAAYVGAMFAVQGAPMEWVSDHRCEEPLY